MSQSHKLWFFVVMFLVISGCSVHIQQPAADSVITVPSSPSTIKVVVTGDQQYTNLTVAIDGTDYSNQMVYQGNNRDEGNLSLAAGRHTIIARADVFCFYCTGKINPATDTKNFCVAVSGAGSGFPTKTTFSKIDNMSWSSSGGKNLSYAADTNSGITRWKFTRLGGIVSNIGIIESNEFPCKCLRSPDDNKDSQIELGLCDANDPRQQWIGMRQQSSTGRGFYNFENRSLANDGFTWGCLTESSDSKVTQSPCTINDNQLWAVRNNTTNSFETDSNPWGQ